MVLLAAAQSGAHRWWFRRQGAHQPLYKLHAPRKPVQVAGAHVVNPLLQCAAAHPVTYSIGADVHAFGEIGQANHFDRCRRAAPHHVMRLEIHTNIFEPVSAWPRRQTKKPPGNSAQADSKGVSEQC